MKRPLNFIPVLALLMYLASCGQAEREQKLVAREKQVLELRQELNLKANALALQATQLNQMSAQLDSVNITQDSLKSRFPLLVGKWQVSMTCTETNCPGSAVGDTKTEQWLISKSAGSIIVQAYSNQTVNRVYVGKYHQGSIRLTAQPILTDIDTTTNIKVVLQPQKDSVALAGTRTIHRADCTIVYEMTLKKQ